MLMTLLVISANLFKIKLKYLGLPLSVKKLPRSVFMELIDKIASKLPGWKAAVINQAGRLTLVRSVLTAIPIYHLIATQCPKWVVKAIDNIRRGFVWKGRKDVKGGHCVVSWTRVCRPLCLGGLGIHNLEILGWALSLRWLWLKKTQPDKSRIWYSGTPQCGCFVLSLSLLYSGWWFYNSFLVWPLASWSMHLWSGPFSGE